MLHIVKANSQAINNAWTLIYNYYLKQQSKTNIGRLRT